MAQAVGLMALVLQVEYRFIVYYPRLEGLLPDDESRATVRMLGEASVRHADLVGRVIRALGGTPGFPALEPFPDLPVVDIFRRQLEYEKLALMLHRGAAALVGQQWRELLRGVAEEERSHILGVEKILKALG